MDELAYGPIDNPSYYYGSSGSGSSFDWAGFSSGLGNTLSNLTNIYANTWAQTQLMQQAQNGQRYIEGQRIATLQAAGNSISPILLLLGAGLVFVLATRGD